MGALGRVVAAIAVLGLLAPSPAAAATPAVAYPSTTPSASPTPQVAGEPAAQLPRLGTRAWVLADLDSGEILASFQPDERLRPASTMKLLTALTVVPRLHPDQPYRAVRADATSEGNRVVMYEGMTYTVEDLVHATLLPSANDAADALARANGGIEATLQQMNAEAARLGATSTVARNASGLDADDQVTTARDMAVIGRAALTNPRIGEYLSLTSVPFPGRNAQGEPITYPIYNQNKMLVDGFPGAMGGKSGYTSGALRTFVGAAQQDGRRLLVSMLGIRGNIYTTAERLLRWGFTHADDLQPVSRLTVPRSPAPQFTPTVSPLPQEPSLPAETPAGPPADAPTATTGASAGWFPALPLPDLPSPLTILTLLVGIIALLRARVYWLDHRRRTSWTTLAQWSRRNRVAARRLATSAAGAEPSGSPAAEPAQDPARRAPADPARSATPSRPRPELVPAAH